MENCLAQTVAVAPSPRTHPSYFTCCQQPTCLQRMPSTTPPRLLNMPKISTLGSLLLRKSSMLRTIPGQQAAWRKGSNADLPTQHRWLRSAAFCFTIFATTRMSGRRLRRLRRVLRSLIPRGGGRFTRKNSCMALCVAPGVAMHVQLQQAAAYRRGIPSDGRDRAPLQTGTKPTKMMVLRALPDLHQGRNPAPPPRRMPLPRPPLENAGLLASMNMPSHSARWLSFTPFWIRSRPTLL